MVVVVVVVGEKSFVLLDGSERWWWLFGDVGMQSNYRCFFRKLRFIHGRIAIERDNSCTSYSIFFFHTPVKAL